MTEDPRMSHEAFGRFVTGQRQLAQHTLRELSARYPASRSAVDKKA
jgi:hypothetical protein